MPFANICIIKGHAADRVQAVIKGVSDAMERITKSSRTVWVTEIDPALWALEGVTAEHMLRTKPIHEVDAPLVTLLLMRGRPIEQHRDLIAAVTEIIVKELGLAPKAVRVDVQESVPESFGIGGVQISAMSKG